MKKQYLDELYELRDSIQDDIYNLLVENIPMTSEIEAMVNLNRSHKESIDRLIEEYLSIHR